MYILRLHCVNTVFILDGLTQEIKYIHLGFIWVTICCVMFSYVLLYFGLLFLFEPARGGCHFSLGYFLWPDTKLHTKV